MSRALIQAQGEIINSIKIIIDTRTYFYGQNWTKHYIQFISTFTTITCNGIIYWCVTQDSETLNILSLKVQIFLFIFVPENAMSAITRRFLSCALLIRGRYASAKMKADVARKAMTPIPAP